MQANAPHRVSTASTGPPGLTLLIFVLIPLAIAACGDLALVFFRIWHKSCGDVVCL